MSLESQIGSLVEAANNLTGTVAGKMGEIDERVDNLSGEFAEAVRQRNDVTFYLDPEEGDDNNSGLSWTNALRGFEEVTRRMLPGGVYTVYLNRDYLLNRGKELRPPAGSQVEVRGSGGMRKLILGWDGVARESGTNIPGCFDLSHGSKLFLRNLELDIDDPSISAMYDTENLFSNRVCFLRTNASSTSNVLIHLRLHSVDLKAFLEKVAALHESHEDQPRFRFMEVQRNAAIISSRQTVWPDDPQIAIDHFFRETTGHLAAPLQIMSNLQSIFRD